MLEKMNSQLERTFFQQTRTLPPAVNRTNKKPVANVTVPGSGTGVKNRAKSSWLKSCSKIPLPRSGVKADASIEKLYLPGSNRPFNIKSCVSEKEIKMPALFATEKLVVASPCFEYQMK